MCSEGGVPSLYLGQLFLSDTLQQNGNQRKTSGRHLTCFTVLLTIYNVGAVVLLHDIVFFADLGE